MARTASGPGEIRAPGLPLPPGLTPPGGTELLPASVLWRMAPICVPVCGAGVGGGAGGGPGLMLSASQAVGGALLEPLQN